MSEISSDVNCTAFISYSRDDKEWVDDFVKQLKRVTHNVWYDDGIPGGAKWWKEILKQIQGNTIFICLLSMGAVKSVNCREELAYAIELNKPIIPIWIHQTDDEKNNPNEKIHHLGDLWSKFSDTQVKDIVVETYISNSTEALYYTMDIGRDICELALKFGAGNPKINWEAQEPEIPRYRTENDFNYALERTEALMLRGDFPRAEEICKQVISDSNGEYPDHEGYAREFIADCEEKRAYKKVKDNIEAKLLNAAKRNLKKYKDKYCKKDKFKQPIPTSRSNELQKLLNRALLEDESWTEGIKFDDDEEDEVDDNKDPLDE